MMTFKKQDEKPCRLDVIVKVFFLNSKENKNFAGEYDYNYAYADTISYALKIKIHSLFLSYGWQYLVSCAPFNYVVFYRNTTQLVIPCFTTKIRVNRF